jgi:hypothetical protein
MGPMSKLVVAIGLVLVTIGAYLLLTMPTPTHAQMENPYGYWGDGVHKIGGWGGLIGGVLILGIGIVRAVRTQRHDPDLPPEHRV